VTAPARPRFARCLASSAAISERGSGVTFPHYPPGVTEVVAVEPEPNLRALAEAAARAALLQRGRAHRV
jgi:hypothetical protein